MTNRATEIANTIRQQLGNLAFSMVGAKDLMSFNEEAGAGLMFKIGRNSKKVQWVKITLAPSDTYSVEFSRITPRRLNKKTLTHSGGEKKILSKMDGLYTDMLKPVIEEATGMYLSLR